jgi:Holliday junction resolvase-like predicted endonuclease
MDERSLVNEGPLAEQFVGQELLFRHGGTQMPDLNYWLREGRSNNAEIDFVISKGQQILPIEVKAGKSGTLKSLQQFILKTKVSQALRFDLNPPSRQTIKMEGASFELLSLPIYMAGMVLGLLEEPQLSNCSALPFPR